MAASGCEYVPMIWGEKDMTAERLANLEGMGKSSYLLGFNEPNFGSQVRDVGRVYRACRRCPPLGEDNVITVATDKSVAGSTRREYCVFVNGRQLTW